MLTQKQTENEDLEKILKDIGLTDVEARVYLATLSLGNTTVLQLARATEIKRTTLYSIIESLKQKGLLKIELKGFKKFFVAENPEHLSLVLEEKAKQFKKSLSLFSALYNPNEGENTIAYHEGLQSVKAVYEELLSDLHPGDPYFVISNDDEWWKLDQNYFEKFTERRSKKGLDLRLIFADTESAREHKKFEKNFSEKIKFLPRKSNIHINMAITPNTLVLHQLTAPIHALVIKTKSILDFHRQLFEVLWQSLN